MRLSRLPLLLVACAILLSFASAAFLGCGGERRPCSAPVHSLDQASSAEPER